MKERNYSQYNKNWLQDHINVTQWDNRQNVQKYGMIGLKSLLLEGNQKFQQLRNMIIQYNREVQLYQSGETGAINHAGLKHNFMASLFRMLTEICLMANIETQSKYLEDVFKWAHDYEFNRKERPVTATTRATRPTTAGTRPTSGISVIVPLSQARFRYDRNATERQIQELNNQLMNEDGEYENMMQEDRKAATRVQTATSRDKSSRGPSKSTAHQKSTGNRIGAVTRMSELEKQDFVSGARTLHSEYQIPSQRLKQYKRKNIDLEADVLIQESKKRDPVAVPKPAPPVKKVIVPPVVPTSSAQMPPQTMLSGDSMPIQGISSSINNIPVDGAPVQTDQVVDGGADDGLQVDDEALIEGDGQLAVQEVQQDQVQDKLAPKTKAYCYNNTEKPQHNNLIDQEARYLDKRNREVEQLRTDQQMIEKAKWEWARSKARIEKQASRKRQSMLTNGKLGTQNYVSKPNQETVGDVRGKAITISHPPEQIKQIGKPSHIEKYKDQLTTYSNNYMISKRNDVIQARVDDLAYTHSRGYDPIDSLTQAQTGLRQKLAATSLTQNARPQSCTTRHKSFAEVLSSAQQKIQAQSQEELAGIKERLAKNKVAIQAERLRSAITSVRVSDHATAEQVASISGASLLHNPFFKVAKKKKKKKK